MDGSETLLSKQLGAVSEAASAAAAAGMSAAAEAAKAAKAAQLQLTASERQHSAQKMPQRRSSALRGAAPGRQCWMAARRCGVLCCAQCSWRWVLWSSRRKFDELTADTSQGALRSLAAAHPEAVCLNAEMEWYGSRAERVYLACGKQVRTAEAAGKSPQARYLERTVGSLLVGIDSHIYVARSYAKW